MTLTEYALNKPSSSLTRRRRKLSILRHFSSGTGRRLRISRDALLKEKLKLLLERAGFLLGK